MALIEYKPGQIVTADNDYYVRAEPGEWYELSADYIAGTATVTVNRGRNDYTSLKQAYKRPESQTTDLTLSSSSSDTTAIVKAGPVQPRIIFTVASASSLEVIFNIRRTHV